MKHKPHLDEKGVPLIRESHTLVWQAQGCLGLSAFIGSLLLCPIATCLYGILAITGR